MTDFFRRLFGPRPPLAPDAPAPPPPAANLPAFPFPLVTVPGDQALATWQRLRAEGKGWPVVLGGDEDLMLVTEGLLEIDTRAPEDILAAARTLRFPASLIEQRAEDRRRAREWLRENGHDDGEDEEHQPEVGDWPDAVEPLGLTVATDVLTGAPLDAVHLCILPCATGSEAMAFLRWGGWNKNPPAEHHVAALRSWEERFGAELVGLSHDTMNLHVAVRPATRDAALSLAREHYLYCNDVVDQGTETLAALGGALMDGDWWYFWWD
jgi:hypothetical protein